MALPYPAPSQPVHLAVTRPPGLPSLRAGRVASTTPTLDSSRNRRWSGAQVGGPCVGCSRNPTLDSSIPGATLNGVQVRPAPAAN